MKPKQKEMDGILEKIYNSFTPKDRTLMVICGDHGMNDVNSSCNLISLIGRESRRIFFRRDINSTSLLRRFNSLGRLIHVAVLP